jgi:adenylate cyclase
VTSERIERKPTTILAADVAGYSRPIGANEEGTTRRLRALHTELITDDTK